MKFNLLGLLLATFVPGSQRATGIQSVHAVCPIVQSEASGLNERSEVGMGFSQTATAHHFYLTTAGGVIQVPLQVLILQPNYAAAFMNSLRIVQDFFRTVSLW
jgi:hypothetical protein